MNHVQLKNLKRFSISFILISFCLMAWENQSFLKMTSVNFERATLDYRYKNFMPQRLPSKDIVFVDIDDQSLNSLNERLGRWPWSREVTSNAIEYIEQGNPKIILVDILYSENDKKNPEKDDHLAKTISNYKNVSFALSFENFEGQKADRLPASQVPYSIDIKNYQQKSNNYFLSYTKPFSPLWENLSHVHVVNTTKDLDGLFRFVPLFFEYNSEVFPSLTFKAVAQFINNPTYIIEDHLLLFLENNVTKYTIPLDDNFNFKLHFYPNKNLFKTIKFDKIYQDSLSVLQGEISDPEAHLKKLKEDFENKIVLIGGSATGLQDLKVTNIDKDFPGALLHGTAISNILNNNYLKTIPVFSKYLIAIFFMVVIYLSFIFLNNVIVKNIIPVMVMGGYFYLSLILFQNNEIDLPIATPLIFGFLSYGDGILYLTLVEAKQKKKIMGTLSKYLSPQVTTQLIEKGIDPTAEVGHKQELTILFSDIRGFTTLSETVKPEQVVEMLNFYLARMTDVVFNNQGTLDKFIGDAVMAFWGAPVEDKKHALNAVISALSMKFKLKEINKHFLSKYNMEFKIGIGVNTGSVIVGNIGSNKRLDYTVIGDNVNLASRLEGLTKNYGIEILIGEATFSLIKDSIFCRPIDWVLVKGKKEATSIYEPIVLKSSISKKDQELYDTYSKGLGLYKRAEFHEAKINFEDLVQKYQDPPSKVMMDRCVHLIESPPIEWTGVYKFTSK